MTLCSFQNRLQYLLGEQSEILPRFICSRGGDGKLSVGVMVAIGWCNGASRAKFIWYNKAITIRRGVTEGSMNISRSLAGDKFCVISKKCV